MILIFYIWKMIPIKKMKERGIEKQFNDICNKLKIK